MNNTATTESDTAEGQLSLHDALAISPSTLRFRYKCPSIVSSRSVSMIYPFFFTYPLFSCLTLSPSLSLSLSHTHAYVQAHTKAKQPWPCILSAPEKPLYKDVSCDLYPFVQDYSKCSKATVWYTDYLKDRWMKQAC